MKQGTASRLAASLSLFSLSAFACGVLPAAAPAADPGAGPAGAITLHRPGPTRPARRLPCRPRRPRPRRWPTEAPRQLQTTQGVPLPTAVVVTLAGEDPDLAGLKRIDTKSAFFFVPESYQVIDMGRNGRGDGALDAGSCRGNGRGVCRPGHSAPGETVTPPALDEMTASMQFDLLMAADAAGESAVFLVGSHARLRRTCRRCC